MNRRQFLKGMAATAGSLLGSGMLGGCALGEATRRMGGDPALPMPMRTLGRTGMRVTAVSMGAMQCPDPAVIRYAVEKGINFIDTADCYLGGNSERIVGEAVAGAKGRVFLATKVHLADPASMIASMERSLRSMKVPTIDLMQVHGVGSRGEVQHPGAREAFTRMKKEGKIRFAGVTTHGGQEEVLDAVAEDGFYDTVLVACSFLSPPSLWQKVEDAAKKGVGIIAMKTQGGGYPGSPFPGLTPHQAALRAVLEKPGMGCAIPGMYHKGMVDENAGAFAAGGKVAQPLLLDSWDRELLGKACAFCGTCRATCPRGRGGMEAVRVGMYLWGYRDPALARERGEEVREQVAFCASCPGCEAECPRNLDIRGTARRVERFLNA